MGGSFRATEESAATGAEGKAERFPHSGLVPTSTHQPERLVCSPAGAGGDWELRLWLWSCYETRYQLQEKNCKKYKHMEAK